jgi:hypothetical protein
MSPQPAAIEAKRLLHGASQRLRTQDPVPEMAALIDSSLALPLGDSRYRGHTLIEPAFNETAADSLAFVMEPGGPVASPLDRAETGTATMRALLHRHFGPEALRWFDGRSEPMRGRSYRANNWGALFGSGFDRHGMRECQVSYEWGPGLMDALPPALYHYARLAIDALPALRPGFSSIRCGRSSGSQQVTFEIDGALPLANLQPLMEALGLGHQHAGLMSAVAFLLGSRFTLPPGTAALTLRPVKNGPELRLDVNLDAIPDPPPELLTLLRMQMAERPRSLSGLDTWLMALTPDGLPGPGSVSVLSVRVQPDVPARVALYLRPESLAAEPGAPVAAAPSQAPQLVTNGA